MVMMPEAPTAQPLASGVTIDRLYPGGKDGPDGAVLDSDQLGGGVWSEFFFVGSVDDPWRLLIPDIRMARNQLWPMHWHDCWIAIIVLDGSCMVGDWWMYPGDVLISPAKVEYGPMLNGPKGCQMLEVFAQDILAPGGYGPEFHDHPTLAYLQGVKSQVPAAFLPRPAGSEGNLGNQTTPLATLPGVLTGRLQGGQRWDLGKADDPERGVVIDTKLAAGITIPGHHHRDWRGVLVHEGSMRIADTELAKDDLLIIEPAAEVPAFETGAKGVHLVEFAKTAAALPVVFRAADRDNPAYREGLAATTDAVFE
jgi:anti-sigma factor ChrR (cupin superfamily)